jgi:hypothetical protein
MASPSRKASDGRIKLGEVRNPEGRNQYTYRRDFDKTVVGLLEGELTEKEAQGLPEWARELISPEMTRGEVFAVIAVSGALRGDEKQFFELLKRVWPAPAGPKAPEDVPEEPEPWKERREGQQLEDILPPELMHEIRQHIAYSLMRQPSEGDRKS